MITKAPLRAVIVGLGSIGRRHLSNLRAIAPESEITIWRHTRPEAAAEDVPGANRVVYDLEAVLDFKPTVALLANPAPYHVTVGSALAAHDVHLFIEKPISHRLDGVSQLIAECHRRNLALMVGYPLRFNPSLEVARQTILEGKIGRLASIRAEVGSYLPDWRPESDYRTTVSARSELGGGAVLELSHELDYVRWLGGDVATVSAHLGRLGDLEMDVEDTAEITLQMTNGCLANVHLDMMQRSPTRVCRVIGREGTLLWDGITNSVQVYSGSSATWSTIHSGDNYDRNSMYVLELEEFLESVHDRREPAVTGEDGRRTLEIALAAKRSDQEQRVVRL